MWVAMWHQPSGRVGGATGCDVAVAVAVAMAVWCRYGRYGSRGNSRKARRIKAKLAFPFSFSRVNQNPNRIVYKRSNRTAILQFDSVWLKPNFRIRTFKTDDFNSVRFRSIFLVNPSCEHSYK